MSLRILLAALLFLSLTFFVAGQDQTENPDSESKKVEGTRKFDEFGKLNDCALGARIYNLFIELSQTPKAKGYIIIYRGADALPAEQTSTVVVKQVKRIGTQIKFGSIDESKIVLIDGGFRKTDSVWNEVWIVPDGEPNPEPTETVEKPEFPKNKAFKVDEGNLDIYEALIEKKEPIREEIEQQSDEILESTIENSEVNLQTEDSTNKTEENTEENSNELPEEINPYYWTSDYFAQSLKENKKAKGVVIFYADEEEFDIGKSRQIVEEGLSNLAEKSEVDLNKVDIIFGGYRSDPKIEYWIVPKGAKALVPTPEQKILKEPEIQ